MVAVPLLGGALLRLVLGLLTDHIGARRTGILGMSLDDCSRFCWAGSGPTVSTSCLLVGLLLGVAGASFAAALPLASRWYPPRYQGLAMGIAGAGNSGTALATFFGPRLAQVWGWHAVFGLAHRTSAGDAGFFRAVRQGQPEPAGTRSLADYAEVLRMRDTWWFCLFYSITFGGFVGLASFLNVFFLSQYGLSRVQAGNFTTLCVLAGLVPPTVRRLSCRPPGRSADADGRLPRRRRGRPRAHVAAALGWWERCFCSR